MLFEKSVVETVCLESVSILETFGKETCDKKHLSTFLSSRSKLCHLVQASDPSTNALVLAKLHLPRNAKI